MCPAAPPKYPEAYRQGDKAADKNDAPPCKREYYPEFYLAESGKGIAHNRIGQKK